ncbi:hypothetical protein HXX76_003195 [Chlamydomonas incerta]|uniref:Uncharacterized protein n=1 Tax=Chlamydomonas incerta TaxID=51695 RepID=A0A835TJF1_CHLIN|nr:hypothetical protein HXX76_003195 [Chlamydomonas incerta]|eukprot:KAG2441574.1 hypothetical protein HXX76_003195 [Chlamydomonas incerta]
MSLRQDVQHHPDQSREHETAIEDASVIHLLRVLMAGGESAAPSPGDGSGDVDMDAGPGDVAPSMSAEDAGCLLWDMSASRPVARLMQRYRAAEALEVVAARQLAALRQSGGGGIGVSGDGGGGLPEDAAEGEGRITPTIGEPGAAASGGGEGGDAAATAAAAATTADAAAPGSAACGRGASGAASGSAASSLRLLEICLSTLANLVATQPLQLELDLARAGGGGGGGRSADGGEEGGSGGGGGGGGGADGPVAASGLLTLLLAPPADADDGSSGGVAAAAQWAAVVWDAGTSAAALGGGAWGGLLWLDDARVLSELCRLCSVALRAQQRSTSRPCLAALRSPAALRRLLWVAAATADAVLFARCLDLVVAVLHASAAAVREAAAVAAETAAAAEAAVAAVQAQPDSEGEEQEAAGACGLAAAAVAEASSAAAAADAAAVAAAAVAGELLGGGLLELVHAVLQQALQQCLPLEDKYGNGDEEYGRLDAEYGDTGEEYDMAAAAAGRLAAAAAGSAGSGAAATASAAAAAAMEGAVEPAALGATPARPSGSVGMAQGSGPCVSGAGSSAPPAGATPQHRHRYGTPPRAARPDAQLGAREASRLKANEGAEGLAAGRGQRHESANDGQLDAGEDGAPAAGAAAAAAAAAVVVAAAALGSVPLSDEALDAVLRVIEELVSEGGPLASPELLPPALLLLQPGAAAAASNGAAEAAEADSALTAAASPAELLRRLHGRHGLAPELPALLVGLLLHHTDAMQVLEGLLVVLVDMGRDGLPRWVAAPATAPGEAVAVAARLAEVLRDSCYSRVHGAGSGAGGQDAAAAAEHASAVQLRQGAWYLLAATLRGVATAAAAAATAAGSGKAAAAEGAAGWLAVVPAACRLLASLTELPLAEGCQGYARASCAAGLQLLELAETEAVAAAAEAAVAAARRRHLQLHGEEPVEGELGGGALEGEELQALGETLAAMLESFAG